MKTQFLALATLTFNLVACAHNASLKGNQNMKTNNVSQIYVFESDANGFNTNTVFFDNGEEVVAFDAQFTEELARQSIEFLRRKTQNPISYLVMTHPNPDKFNGASVFKKEGAIIVASESTSRSIEGVHAYKKYFFVNIAKMFSEETYPKPVAVDREFLSRLELKLSNGDSVILSEADRAGVSSNQTVAWIPSANALVVGDLIHNGVHAWLEGGIVNGAPKPDLVSWIEQLQGLLKDFDNSLEVFGGRGISSNLKKSVKSQILYLQKADSVVGEYVSSLGNRSSELLGVEAGIHHAELAKRFEKAFPKYKHSYMIQYGVYGLTNSKIQ
jgi:glyoxylase-like metal-dependent hydrolase (beta-lactamase superfamily II)